MPFFIHYVLVILISATLVLIVQKYTTSVRVLAGFTFVSFFGFWFLTSASVMQYTLSTFPQNNESEKFKKYAVSLLNKEMEKVQNGENKEVEKRYKYFVEYI